eukprot:393396_1
MQDEKKSMDTDDDDCDQEALVHADGDDFREKIYESGFENEPIIQCIGQLQIMYRYSHPESYNLKMVGTATVFAANAANKTVYGITCAHNLRRHVLNCRDCGRYMELDTTQCIDTNCSSTKLKKKMIKATKIQFQRRSIKKKYYKGSDNEKEEVIFGDVIKTYNNIHCEFINDSMFEIYYKAPHGYDLAIISFIDATQFYSSFCKHVKITNDRFVLDKSVQGKEVVHFNLFGYPGDKNVKDEYQMWGMESSGNDYWIKRNNKTKHEYLKHQEIDSFAGQSGAAIWYIDDIGNNVIFAVHAGGNQQRKFNIATLLNAQDIMNIGLCCPSLHNLLLQVVKIPQKISKDKNKLNNIDAIVTEMFNSQQILDPHKIKILCELLDRQSDYKLTINWYFQELNLSRLIPIFTAANYQYLEDLKCENHEHLEKILSICGQKLKLREKRNLKLICLRSDSWMKYQKDKIETVHAYFVEISPLMVEFLDKLILLSQQQTVYNTGIKNAQQNVSIVDVMEVSFNKSLAAQSAKQIAMCIEGVYGRIMSGVECITKCLILAQSILQSNQRKKK